jgi:predicted pyridoxine 5'-phosphate oxidase superfamily flavin-nucleotide-binding protein
MTAAARVYASDVAFTPAVKEIQTRKGSREAYARVEQQGWRTEVDEKLAGFLADANSFYFATASADGQPYIQHRGGPKGFLKVLDKQTLAFADYAGNQQFLSQGNLSENPKAYIFIMDYAHRRRVKIWGEARVVEDDDALTESLMPKGYRARPEQVIVFKITAWDTNCPQHIPQKFDAADVAAALAARDQRIAELEGGRGAEGADDGRRKLKHDVFWLNRCEPGAQITSPAGRGRIASKMRSG